MKVSRIETALTLDNVPGKLNLRTAITPTRAGWKEIVITSTDSTPIIQASQSGADPSRSANRISRRPHA